MYLTNMVALAKKDANQVIEEYNEDKRLKYEYKVNTNVLVGKLKDTLIEMLVAKPWKPSKMLKQIQDEIARNVIPIRLDRSVKRRNHKNTQMDNKMHKKRAL